MLPLDLVVSFDGKDGKVRRMRCWLISRLLQQEEECLSYSLRYLEGEINT